METATTRKYTNLQKLAASLLDDAVANPFGDWFHFSDVKCDKVYAPTNDWNWVVSAQVVAELDESGEKTVTKTITIKDVIRAMRIIASSDKVGLHDSFRKRFAAALHVPDESDFDAIDSDAVLQVAIFGEVIYG